MLSSLQTKSTNGIDDISTTKPEQENDFNCSSSSSAASKRLTGTLNRLLNSAINRPNGQHYHNNPLASSSNVSQTIIDSAANEPKASLEMNTQAIESILHQGKTNICIFDFLMHFHLAFVQHFDSSFNTMTYFQEKLQQLLVSIARKEHLTKY